MVDRKMDNLDDLILESEKDAVELEKALEFRDEAAIRRVTAEVDETSSLMARVQKWRDEVTRARALAGITVFKLATQQTASDVVCLFD